MLRRIPVLVAVAAILGALVAASVILARRQDDAAFRAIKQIEEKEKAQLSVATMPSVMLKAYEDYLRRFPDGRHAREAREQIDEQEWLNACLVRTKWSFEHYLARLPQGKHADDARKAIEVREAAAAEFAQGQELFIYDHDPAQMRPEVRECTLMFIRNPDLLEWPEHLAVFVRYGFNAKAPIAGLPLGKGAVTFWTTRNDTLFKTTGSALFYDTEKPGFGSDQSTAVTVWIAERTGSNFTEASPRVSNVLSVPWERPSHRK